MSLIDHLRELRGRMFKAVAAILPGAVIAWIFYDTITRFLLDPVCEGGRTTTVVTEAGVDTQTCGNLTVIGLLGPFNLQLTISFVVGFLIASPVILYQVWAFVTPGLHRHERRWTVLYLATSIPLFFAGAALCYYIMPRTISVLQSFTPEDADNLLPVNEYLSIFVRLLLVFGLSFQLPVFLVLLNFMGIITARKIAGAWRWTILGCVLFGAIATPTGDPFTMLAVAVPMMLLVVLSWAIAWVHDRRRRRDDIDYEDLDDDEISALDTRPSRLDDLD